MIPQKTLARMAQPASSSKAEELVNYLFKTRDLVHFAHLKVQGPGAYAAHKALNEAYDYLLDFADDFAEMLQGIEGRILNLSISASSSEVTDPVMMFQGCVKYLTAIKGNYTSDIINKIEELIGNLNQTIYKLKFLK